jgi:hypothetical protein
MVVENLAGGTRRPGNVRLGPIRRRALDRRQDRDSHVPAPVALGRHHSKPGEGRLIEIKKVGGERSSIEPDSDPA